ncbi:hypothetical protein PoB_002232800 [Plakobranchus ocellatus]|uniref:Uncharacterized protein n=1 Tax=Plakobranchus ocellatus TaxID=259542 RepID=A0AAV3ZLV7_9GAST|nr:hypothetical protein PoB_002232800 [Plakobranchus ocellatus]
MADTMDQCFADDQTGHLMILANDLLQACNGVMDGEGTVPIEMYTVNMTDGSQAEDIKRANDLLQACNGVMDGEGTVPIEMYTVSTTDGSQTENIKSEKHEEVQIGTVLDRAGDVLNGDGNAANSSLFNEQVDAVIKADVVLGDSAEAGPLENEMVTVDG